MDHNQPTAQETILAELAALKLLLLTIVSTIKERDALVQSYLAQLKGLETLSLYESEISDRLREAILVSGEQLARQILAQSSGSQP